MSKTLIISGTNRKEALTQVVAKKYHSLFIQELDVETKFFSLENLPNDFLFAETYGNRSAAFESWIQNHVIWADRFVFLLPEYNGSFPGVMKLFIDGISPKFFWDKKAALVGIASGRAGNLRGMDHFTHVLNHIKVNVYWNKVPISGADKLIANNELVDLNTIEVLQKQIKGFLTF
jgi:chromate reductase, NAD(P)H dehydrogenase (quinone)